MNMWACPLCGYIMPDVEYSVLIADVTCPNYHAANVSHFNFKSDFFVERGE